MAGKKLKSGKSDDIYSVGKNQQEKKETRSLSRCFWAGRWNFSE